MISGHVENREYHSGVFRDFEGLLSAVLLLRKD